ncbi:unnamed protein product [Adineta steineri]|uniref:SH2 domain-containing protein n=1 Tax=Adineta steineri TaxID=433720 RepID=A0A819CVN0_9BILA|nr:unnamed protein product [Adineta steineri]CAF3818140.1 unnamed protein product [Adineta steineri]
MIYTNNFPISTRLSQPTSMLLTDKEAKTLDFNDKLLLPSSTRSIKRRISLLEKSRDWARRLITLHRPRRNTLSTERNHEICNELTKKPEIKTHSSQQLLHNSQKNFDEDGYLSPLEIKAKLDNITQQNTNQQYQSNSKLLSNSDQLHLNFCNKSQVIYRYHDPNISIPPTCQCICQQQKRIPTTSFVSEFQKSLSIVDYIDFDVPDESSKQDDDPLESIKYLFNDSNNNQQQGGYFSRRIPRRTTNVSSISTDSGYSDIPVSSPKLIPVHLISCTLIPVNLTGQDSINRRCLTCTCRPSSSSLSTTCLPNQQERKLFTHSSRSYISHQPVTHINKTENEIHNQCTCNNKYHSTMTIYPSSPPPPIPKKSRLKINDYKDEYYYQQQQQQTQLVNKQANVKRLTTITTTTDDLTSIARWYKPYLERGAVCDVLQQADYGTFILRNSTTHTNCYALSIKVPKFTHDSNIVHYLIEKTVVDNNPSYRIKGTIKQFPTLLSLLTHHSVMPEILPITLNLNESFTI